MARAVTPDDSAADADAGTRSIERRGHDAGVALRSAYQAMVDEDIPQELLDLLSKLD
ncbi:MAG: NepR family anti-sigma factor [Sphingomonas sp.]